MAATSASLVSRTGFASHSRRRFSATVQCAASVAERRASARSPRRENVAGDFYVDHTCIDCDTCRAMAPGVYKSVGPMSAVYRQPETPEERQTAIHALFACPTFSIHVRNAKDGELKAAADSMPLPMPGCPGVFDCGYASEKSFGSSSYLIQRDNGNIMVDSPRFSPGFAKRIESMGGIKYIFLTHKDDVADHAQWAKHFGAKRIIHELETTVSQGTSRAEIQLEGEGPWKLEDGSEDVDIVFTPGHTEGHCCLYYHPAHALFSGDHLGASSREMTRLGLDYAPLAINRRYNWYSVDKQLSSVHKVLDYDFLHVFPGHGRQLHFKDAADRLKRITRLLQEMGFVAPN